MGRLVIYDTSNFDSFPLGGQLTSIKSFLWFLSEFNPELASRTVLVGVTLNPLAIGRVQRVEINGFPYKFFPVASANEDENNPKKSLRLAFFMGLVKHLRKLKLSDNDVNLIETPEAFSPVKLWGGKNRYVFSHGSFLGMGKNLRFFAGSPIPTIFERYLVHVIDRADGVFVLDHNTLKDYSRYNQNVHLLRNSIVERCWVERNFNPKAIRLLFVGRLSAVKGIPRIIEAVEIMPDVESLTLVGAGELQSQIEELDMTKVMLAGAVSHDLVKRFMYENDILIMNSSHEGVPMVILEAMAVGMPIVSTPVGGVPETVAFGRNAEMTSGDVESIAFAIRKIAANYAAYSASSYELSESYHYSVVNSYLLSLLPASLAKGE